MTTTAAPPTSPTPFPIETHPSRYRHWKLAIDGDVATLRMNVDPEGGQRGDDYELKLNSYDIGVDIELADAIQRLRFEHPAVRCVVLTGALDRVFCAGANIVMLRTSTHAFKVNFCKFTNETRLGIEDASRHSGLRFLAALNGTASGGGYELALACDKILLVDDRNSAVSFPEVPLLGVLPGTGGLTRITDKRKLRRDRNDLFSTLAEGIKGKRAVEWNLVDRLAPLSKWDQEVARMAGELAQEAPARGEQGVELPPLEVRADGDALHYEYVQLALRREERFAELTIRAPEQVPATADQAFAQGADWWALRAFRELDDALVRLRLFEPEIGLVLLRTAGSFDALETTDALLAASDHWFVNEVRHLIKRTLKRLEVTAKSFYAVADEGTGLHRHVPRAGAGLRPHVRARRLRATGALRGDGRARRHVSDGQWAHAPADALLGHARSRRRRAGAGRPLRRGHGRRARPGQRGRRRDRLGGRAAPGAGGTRFLLPRRPHRHGGQPALPRARDDGDQGLRTPLGLAELDLSTPQRRRRARGAAVLRHAPIAGVRRLPHLKRPARIP